MTGCFRDAFLGEHLSRCQQCQACKPRQPFRHHTIEAMDPAERCTPTAEKPPETDMRRQHPEQLVSDATVETRHASVT